jgi:hypothetical protein
MRKEAILALVIIVVWTTGLVYFLTRPIENKVSSFKEVKTQTLEEVEIKKISDELPRGLYEVKVNDSLTILVYSESRGNSMIRIK